MPTGELPRSILLAVDRCMVGTIAPGTRVTAVGIYSTFQVQPDKPRLSYKSADRALLRVTVWLVP